MLPGNALGALEGSNVWLPSCSLLFPQALDSRHVCPRLTLVQNSRACTLGLFSLVCSALLSSSAFPLANPRDCRCSLLTALSLSAFLILNNLQTSSVFILLGSFNPLL